MRRATVSPASTTGPAAGARALAHPAREDIRLEAVLHALSDPVRLCVVRELAAAEGELTCSCFDLPVTKSTTTHHFRVLRESGIVRQTYRGTAKMNGLRRDALEELFPGLLDRVLEAAAREAERLGES
ncbi:DNA-binding transcriptional ArsR family regulator [Streptomyces sp. KhCrAH-43]|uniref:ArsR/SmtB family transcription factor n=1 Tax=Streptomyces TaxID=1883 RepID=UPI0004B2FB97|nr:MULTISPECIES: helix-turn-helix domain-containing protein [unclassified Streptomyces]MYS37015.1 helix-turn-helix domain-containing protein [Streptomyces sp. SID4920]MYX69486.1 helix-turn-helix domain-containing protein [Streptomyces sp. SID8373]RAJ62339.1 DNA-binding transcriptional ArsR family regulator [Streptomyces sp. KhCrAH-43]